MFLIIHSVLHTFILHDYWRQPRQLDVIELSIINKMEERHSRYPKTMDTNRTIKLLVHVDAVLAIEYEMPVK